MDAALAARTLRNASFREGRRVREQLLLLNILVTRATVAETIEPTGMNSLRGFEQGARKEQVVDIEPCP
jgi:hypothetical protein